MTDKKEIDSLAFWKKRIDTAQLEHYSVYVTTDADWKRIFEAHKAIIEEHVEGNVLDLGCGYGRMSELFDSKYEGVDFSPDFIAKAKEKYPKKIFKVADLRKLPYEDNAFDWGIAVSIKDMIVTNLGEEEWKKMEAEARRVCKHVLLLEYTKPSSYEII